MPKNSACGAPSQAVGDQANTALGDKLKKLRLAKGLSIMSAAKASGVSKTYVWKLENRKVNPSQGSLLKLAKLYEVSVSDLIGENPRSEDEAPHLVAIYRELKELSRKDLALVETVIKQLRSQ